MPISVLRIFRNILRIPSEPKVLDEICDQISGKLDIRVVTLWTLRRDGLDNPQVMNCSSLQRRAMYSKEYRTELAEIAIKLQPAFEELMKGPEFMVREALEILPIRLHPFISYNAERLYHYFGAYNQYVGHFGIHEKIQGGLSFSTEKSRRLSENTCTEEIEPFLHLLGDAYQLRCVFDELQQRYRRILGVLDHLLLGVIIVDSRLNIILKNRSADEIINNSVELSVAYGKLAVSDEVKSAIGATFDRFSMAQAGRHNRREFCLRDSDLLDRFAAFVRPFRLTTDEFDENIDSAVIVIVDRYDTKIRSLKLTSSAFGLTNAEIDTLQHIVAGLTYREVSDLRGVALETTKSHVGAILNKAECRRVAELLLRVSRLDTPFDFNEENSSKKLTQ